MGFFEQLVVDRYQTLDSTACDSFENLLPDFRNCAFLPPIPPLGKEMNM